MTKFDFSTDLKKLFSESNVEVLILSLEIVSFIVHTLGLNKFPEIQTMFNG